MSKINKEDVVKEQYTNSDNLNIRISIHNKYSSNKMGFKNWIFSNYDISPNINILELGCGIGDMWKLKINCLNDNIKLYLTDFSQGMISSAKSLIGNRDNLVFNVVNIEDIPYENNFFDRVVANMMLYHVSNIDKGLSEIVRVLKDDGYFYCATYGENRIADYVAKLVEVKIDDGNKNFTLQNGKDILNKYFSTVKRLDYNDSLEITNIDDLLDYIYSLENMSSITKIERTKLKSDLEKYVINGVLKIPKEYGMFICRK